MYLELGKRLALAGDEGTVEALGHFRAALVGRPAHVVPHNNLGVMLLRQRDAAGAARCFGEAVAYFDARLRERIYCNLGLAAAATGDRDGALCWYRKAAQDPSCTAAHFRLGEALADQGEWAEAAHWLQQAVTLQPGHARAQAILRRVLARQR